MLWAPAGAMLCAPAGAPTAPIARVMTATTLPLTDDLPGFSSWRRRLRRERPDAIAQIVDYVLLRTRIALNLSHGPPDVDEIAAALRVELVNDFGNPEGELVLLPALAVLDQRAHLTKQLGIRSCAGVALEQAPAGADR